MIKIGLKQYIGDAVLCVFLAVFIIGVSLWIINSNMDTNRQVRILHNGEEIGVYNLAQENSFEIDGVHIKIKNGKAVIFSSDCPDKICTEMQGVDKDGGGAVCLPNKIILEPVTSNKKTDATAG